MQLHNTCTRKSNYLVFFIKTVDAHKIRMLSPTIFNTFKECNRGGGDGNIVKNDGGCFQNYRNKLFSGKPIFRFGAGHFVSIFVILTFLTALFALSGIATKSAIPLLKVIHHILEEAHQAELFLNKIFSLNSVLQIVLFMVLFWFFLKFGTLLQFFVL